MFYQKTILNNGITVISEYLPSVRSVSLGVWLHVGSRDESLQEAGLSHFLEHMMFKGTEKRTAQDISEEFESMGAEFNAFTSKEQTCYHARFAKDKLSSVLDILSDMVIHSQFKDEDIRLEREVVLEEIARANDTPDDIVFDLFSDAIFPNHSLGRPVLGDPEIIASTNHVQLTAYHNKFYHSSNTVVSAAGAIDHNELVSLCEQYFADMNTGTRQSRILETVDTCKDLVQIQKDTEQVQICLGFKSLSKDDPRAKVASLIDTILGGGMSSRLFQEIREKRGLAYAVSSFSQRYEGSGMFCIYAGTRPNNTDEVIEIAKRELKRIALEEVLEKELQRVKEYIIGLLTLQLESTQSHMMKLGSLECSQTKIESFDEVIEGYRKISQDDITSLAREIYATEPSIALVLPKK